MKLVLSGILLCFMSVSAFAEDLFEAVVFIKVGFRHSNGSIEDYATATGFLVNSTGVLVTAKHIIPPASETPTGSKVIFRGVPGTREDPHLFNLYSYNVVALGNDVDVTFLRFSQNVKRKWPYLTIANSPPPTEKDNVFAAGFPLDQDQILNPGKVTSKTGADPTLVTINAQLVEGMSGGPVLDDANNVLGVIAGAGNLVQGPAHVPTSLNYFTPIQYIKSALKNDLVLAHFGKPDRRNEQEINVPYGYSAQVIACGVEPQDNIPYVLTNYLRKFFATVGEPSIYGRKQPFIGNKSRVYYQDGNDPKITLLNVEIAEQIAEYLQSKTKIGFSVLRTDQSATPTSTSRPFTPTNKIIVQYVTRYCR